MIGETNCSGIVMQVYREVEEFIVRFPSCFLAQRWKNIIIGYLTDIDTTQVASEVVAPFPTKSIVTLAHATLSSNAMSVSMLQAHGVQH